MKTKRKNKVPNAIILGIFLISGLGLNLPGAGTALAALADHAVINEVQVDSILGTGGTEDDWVELFNPTTAEISLNGWSIQKTAGSGSSLNRQALTGSIPAGGYYLIVKNDASTTQSLKDAANILVSSAFDLANNNIVYLVNDNNNIASSTDPNIVDFVGFGTAAYFEGTAAAPSIIEGKSIARIPAGEDTDNNSVDFKLQDVPTPQNSSAESSHDVSGTVLLTIAPDSVLVQNITATGAQISFSVNSKGTALVNYGLSSVYGNSSLPEAVIENTAKIISLTGLACGAIYHYSIQAENVSATEGDSTADAVFATLPCGLKIDSLTMTKTSAKANNNYTDGWIWEFNITIWDLDETTLKMKFAEWSGAGTLNAGGNMQFSVDNGANWLLIAENNSYPAIGAALNSIDLNTDAGRQVKIMARMKVPAGTKTGIYNSSYGILTE